MNVTLPSGVDFDFGTLSKDEVAEKLTELASTNPELFQEVSSGPPDPKTTPFSELKAYYEGSGTDQPSFEPTHPGEITDFETRFEFGKADRADEKEAALTRIFGPDSFGRTKQGYYFLNLDNISPEIKEKKNLKDSGTMYVNQPGGGPLGLFNMPDVYDFLGAYRGELLGGTAAALMSGPLGLFGTSVLIGLGAGLGKGADEFLETVEGTQLQPRGEVMGDIATAAAWNSLGNFIIGGAVKLLGRAIKGPGQPNAQVISNLRDQGLTASEAKTVAVQMQRAATRADIAAGGRPTISDATGKSILGRMQGIHEAIFPNKVAARSNRNYIQSLIEKFKNGELGEGAFREALDQNAKKIQALITREMKDPDAAIKLANQHLRDVIEEELDLIMKVYTPQDATSSFMNDSLARSVRMWQLNNGTLYDNANKALRNMRIFDRKGLKDVAEKMSKEPLAEEMGLAKDPIFRYIQKKENNYTLMELQSLRSLVNNSRSSGLVGNAQDFQLKKLSDELDKMFENANMLFAKRQQGLASNIITYGELGVKPPRGIPSSTIIPKQLRQQYMKQINEGMDLFKAAQEHYKEGAQMFKSGAIEMLNKNIKEGFAPDLLSVVELAVQNNKPQLLRNYLKSVTPEGNTIGVIQKVPQNEWNLMAQAAEAGEINEVNRLLQKNFIALSEKAGTPGFQNLKKLGISFKPPSFIEDLPKNNPYRRRVLGDLAETFRLHADDAFYRATPEAQKNINRDMLASSWLRQAQEKATDLGVFDPARFKRSFDDLGKGVQEELFGKAKAVELNKTLKDLSLIARNPVTGDFRFVEAAASNINNSNMRNIVSNLQSTIAEAEAQSTNALFKAVKAGNIVDSESLVQAAVKNPTFLDDLQRTVPPSVLNQPAGFKDAVMSRIVREAFPDGVTEAAVASGAWQDAMQASIFNMNQRGALNKILGRETIEDLKKLTKIKISDAAIKGKGGIVSAAYAISIGMRVLTEPISGLASVAGVYLSGRILRNPTFLKIMTRPNITAKDYTTGIKALTKDILEQARADGVSMTRSQASSMAREQMGKLSVIRLRLSEIAADEARLFISTKASESTTPERRKAIGQAVSRTAGAVTPVIQSIQKQLPAIGVQAQRAKQVLGDIERDKLLGIR